MRWDEVSKRDERVRRLADRHYSRVSEGGGQFCRPGHNLVLWFGDGAGEACFVWWRPEWEVGRQDGRRGIECTIFRNEGGGLSSGLILEAERALRTWFPTGAKGEHAGCELITFVDEKATQGGRSRWHGGGWCFRKAGWSQEGRDGRGRIRLVKRSWEEGVAEMARWMPLDGGWGVYWELELSIRQMLQSRQVER